MKKNSENVAISLVNVSKRYIIYHEKPTLVENIFRPQKEIFFALRDVNLTIKKGERVGVIGKNGSGKTTLLKLVAGITAPSKGSVATYGKVVSLIDLEAGFHPDLTGIQNIFLNGMLLGLKKNEINQKLSEIINFAGIKKFIDAPLFTYSEGMKMRLGFSVAAFADPDIILLDEALNVGDKDFQAKAKIKLHEFYTQGKTIVIVSHWLDFIRENATKIIFFEKGHLKASGKRTLLTSYKKDIL